MVSSAGTVERARLLRATILAGLIVCLHGMPPLAWAQVAGSGPQLEVRDFRVVPQILRSGETVSVEAVIANTGDASAHGLLLGLTVADVEPFGRDRSGRTWTPLEKTPLEPVEVLVPGDAVRFRGVARLEGDGWFRVGVSGRAANAVLRPQVQGVRVAEPAVALADALALFGIYAALLSAGVAASRRLLRPAGDAPPLAPDRRTLGLGFGLVMFGVAALALARPSHARRFAEVGAAGILELLPFAGVALFVVGWLVAVAALRPRRSPGRGAALAAVLYVLIGLAWLAGFSIGQGTHAAGFFAVLVRSPAVLLLTLLWPWQMAAVVGWFGISNE